MGSLVLFLILLITFSCFIDCYKKQQQTHKPKKGKKGKKGKKSSKKSLTMKKPLSPLKRNKEDYQVCKFGHNLGLVSSGSSCGIKYSNRCRETIVRKPELPKMSKIQKAKLAKIALAKSKKLKKKKKWTLKG